MLDTIPVFENNLLTHELVDNSLPKAFHAHNKSLEKKFCIYPYIVNGNFYCPPNTQWSNPCYSKNIIANIFDLKSEIYCNKSDELQGIFKPDLYDYDYNLIRQVIIDTADNSIIAETGARKLYSADKYANVIKLNHRWYMAERFRDEYIRSRKILGFNNQSHVKQQWLLGKNSGAEIMYQIRQKSNSLWNINFKMSGDFFNEKNGWFFTQDPIKIKEFIGYPFIWYDKRKHTKESALAYLSKL